MKKKLLSVVLALAMVLSLMPAAFAAEETASAAVLPEKVDGVIRLTEEVVLADKWTIAAGDTVTLDLNGQTLDVSAKGIVVNGALTIRDTSSKANGTLTGKIDVITVNKNASLTMESGNLVSTGSTAVKLAYAAGNQFLMTGGTVSAAKGVVNAMKGAVTVTGGRIETSSANSYDYAIDNNYGYATIVIGEPDGSDGDVYISSIRGYKGCKLTVHSGIVGRIGICVNAEDVLNGLFEQDLSSILPAGKICTKNEAYYQIADLTDEAEAGAKIGDKLYASAVRAATELQEGETLVLLQDVEGEVDKPLLKTSVPSATLDLNGHNVRNISTGKNSCAVEMSTTYGNAKDCAMTLVNSGNKTATVTGMIPLKVNNGDSQHEIRAVLKGDNITLQSTGEQTIALGTNVLLPYSEDAARMVANGGYKAVDSNGDAYIYGTFGSAADVDADKTVELLNDYTGSDYIMLHDQTATLDLDGHTYAYTGTGESAAALKMSKNITSAKMTIQNGTITSAADGASVLFDNNSLILDNVRLTVQGFYGIVSNGAYSNDNVTLQNKTVLTVQDGIGIYWPSRAGEVILDNAIVTAKTGVQVCAGGLTVRGENTSITATGTLEPKTDSDGAILDGAAISAIKRDGYGDLTSVKVENGRFQATDASKAIKAYIFNNTNKTEEPWANAKSVVSVSGGHFTTAPDAAYLAEGKALVESSENGYNWMVANKQETAAEVLPAAPEAETKLPADVSQEDKALADSALAALTSKDAGATAPAVDANVMNAEASAIANANTTTPENGLAELKKQGVVTGDSVTADGVTIVVQPYLDIKITGADADGSAKTLTLDITPMYQKVATTADLKNDEEITVKKEGVNDPNAVVLASGKLTVSEPVTVTIPLPDTFAETDAAKIGHKGYVYTGKIDNQHVLTFVNPHGFSAFTIGVEVAAVNETTGEEYTDFQTALDEAKNGETVIIKTAPAADKTFTMSGDSREITVKNGTGSDLTITINGEKHENVKNGESFQVKYTRPSSGGSSSSSYTVNVEDSKNGTVTASHKSASKNTTVTLTVKADKGYELDELTVTDKNGKELKLTDKGNGKYTFAMPASKVDVKATFAEIVEKPAYSDVSASAWYAKAVAYVTEKGMMEGDSGKFMPLDKLTRSQMAQVLFNLEGKKSVNYALTFGDMNGTEWYAEAVRWAASEQIVNGYDNGNFGPNDPITREQLVTVLYRYAQYKGLDTATTEENLTSFADAAQVSGYAVSAMNWAVGAGVINGTDSGLAPKATATRAEVAQILMNFDQKF